MSKVLYCLYDPLCGWCYGATPAISELAGTSNLTVNLLPAGLFSGDRALHGAIHSASGPIVGRVIQLFAGALHAAR